jgi:hypothetical protein
MCCGNVIINHKLKLAVPEIFRSNRFSVLSTHPLKPYYHVERTILWWHSYPSSLPPSPLKHGLTQHQDCGIPAKQAHQFSLTREGPPVLKSARLILHLLQVWKNVHQTGRSTETRVKEHHRHICLYHPEKSAVAAQH